MNRFLGGVLLSAGLAATVALGEPALDPLAPPPVPSAWTTPPIKPAAEKQRSVTAAQVMQTRVVQPVRPVPPVRTAPPRVWPAAHVVRPETPEPHITAGFIVFDADPAPALPAPPREPLVPARLKERVQKACGNLAHGVTVTAQSDRTVHVRVRPAPGVPETTLAERILWLPEMAAPQVRLHIEKGQ